MGKRVPLASGRFIDSETGEIYASAFRAPPPPPWKPNGDGFDHAAAELVTTRGLDAARVELEKRRARAAALGSESAAGAWQRCLAIVDDPGKRPIGELPELAQTHVGVREAQLRQLAQRRRQVL